MNHKIPAYFFLFFLLFTALNASAGDAYRIGVFFWHESSNDYMAFEGIKEGFKATGLKVDYDIQKAYGDKKNTNRIIDQWVAQPPDLLYAMGTGASKQLMKKIDDTPIIFTAVTNPVLSGITLNWKTSGKNVTGNSNWIETEYVLSSFKKVVPSLKKLGIMYNLNNSVPAAEMDAAIKVVHQLGIELVVKNIDKKTDIDQAVQVLMKEGIDALWVPIDILVYKNIPKIRKYTDPKSIPLLSSSHRGISDGAVFGIVVDYEKMGKRSVPIALKVMVDGISPKDIPVGLMRHRKHIVNLKAARQIGFDIPLEILATADEIRQ